MTAHHEDPAATIRIGTARKLVADASPRGRRLLQLFARRQLLEFDELQREFGLSQNGLNALLGGLTRRFQRIQQDPGFYIFLPRIKSWAIGATSRRNLRQALREAEEELQAELRFPNSSRG